MTEAFYEPIDCYDPGWDEGPEDINTGFPFECTLEQGHTGPHSAMTHAGDVVKWEPSWLVDEEDWPYDD